VSEVRYLSLEHVLHIAHRVLDVVEIKDIGMLESAVARPRTTVFGEDAYPTLLEKAAALTHSLGKNHGLTDGNKRLAFASLIGFLGVNGYRLTMTNDEAYDVMIRIAAGELRDVGEIAEIVASHSQPSTF
jgi:death on curing protein